MYVYVYVYIYIYTYIHVYVYIYIYIVFVRRSSLLRMLLTEYEEIISSFNVERLDIHLNSPLFWCDTNPVSITRFPLSRFSPGAGLLRYRFFHW